MARAHLRHDRFRSLLSPSRNVSSALGTDPAALRSAVLAYAGALGVATSQLVSSAHEVAVSQGLVPGGPSLAR
jgi:hypothetical protein